MTTAQYNKVSTIIKENPDEYQNLSFNEFNDYDKLKNAKGLALLHVMCSLYAAGQNVAILSSREDSKMLNKFLIEECNINIPMTHIICINENKEFQPSNITDAELKKQAIIKLAKQCGYTTFIVYDDCDEFNTAIMEAATECCIHVVATSNFLTKPRI